MSRLDWHRPEVVMPQDKRRIALTISYDGTKWHGWQVQDNADSVEGEIEKVLSRVTGDTSTTAVKTRFTCACSKRLRIRRYKT